MNIPAYYAVSGTLFATALIWFVVTARRLSVWHQTSGRVVDVIKEWQSDSEGKSLMHAPVVEFRTIEDNRTVTFQDSVWTSPGWHSPGDTVEVLYNPEDPTQATITGWRPYFVPAVIAFGSVLFLLIELTNSQK